MNAILPAGEWTTTLVAEYCGLAPARVFEARSRQNTPEPIRKDGRSLVWAAADIVKWRGPLTNTLVAHDAWGKRHSWDLEWLPEVIEMPDVSDQVRSLLWGPRECPVTVEVHQGMPRLAAYPRVIHGAPHAPHRLEDDRELWNDGDPLWGCWRAFETD